MWIDDVPIFYRDADHQQTKKFRDSFQALIADYFNAAQGWGKEVYLNNKGFRLNWPDGIGCYEKDNLQMKTAGPKWENPATLGTSYGYMAHEEENDLYKQPVKLIHLLCDIVSKNGNLLLNIGPRSDGTIPEGMQWRLLEMGKWLDINGEAIYGTRAWKTYGEAIIPSVKKRKHAINSTGIRFTRSANGKFVYAILFQWPEKPITIKSFANEKIVNVELLGSDRKPGWNITDAGLNVTLPSRKPCEHAFVLKITK
jgi:alpha-L-fucosidase